MPPVGSGISEYTLLEILGLLGFIIIAASVIAGFLLDRCLPCKRKEKDL